MVHFEEGCKWILNKLGSSENICQVLFVVGGVYSIGKRLRRNYSVSWRKQIYFDWDDLERSQIGAAHGTNSHEIFGRKSKSFWAVYYNPEQKWTINLDSFVLNYFSFYHCKLGCSTSFMLSDMTTMFCSFEKVFFFFLCNQKLATS